MQDTGGLQNTIRISIGILVLKGNSILFGRSRDSTGIIKYFLPVGHLEFLESFTDCAKREILEECGIEIKNIRFQFLSNTKHYKPKHYVHIGLIANWKSGEPQVLEKGSIEAWEWRTRNDLPESLTTGAKLTLNALDQKRVMYED